VQRLRWIFFTGVLALGVTAGAVGFTLYDQYWLRLPPLSKLLTYDPPVATRVYADDGQLVSEFFFEKRYLTPMDKIPAVVRDAFVAAEDSEFYRHRGIDPKGISRAFFANLRAGDVVQGGSTITQQVVKSLLLTPERSYRRKLREVLLSLKIERELSKDEILYLYLNQIYLGDGNYGIGAAARSYFGKDPSELTLPEAALLAGLPKAPSRYSPTRNAEGALTRQRYVLTRMLEEGYITPTAYRAAVRQGVSVVQRNQPRATVGSYYAEYVRRFLVEHFGERATYYQGYRVYTALNLNLQAIAEDTVRRDIEKLDLELGYLGPRERLAKDAYEKRLADDAADPALEELEIGRIYQAIVTATKPGRMTVAVGKHSSQIDVSKVTWHGEVAAKERRFEVGDIIEATPVDSDGVKLLALTQSPEVEAALVAIDAHTGQVKAMVGGYDFARSQFNRATQAHRQPGSAFKPLVYAAALDAGYTPASIVLDAPIEFVDHDRIWSPKNFSRLYYGPTTLRVALEKSRNVVTVRVVQELGVDKVAKYVNRFGFARPIGRNLSLGLGTSEVTPVELVSAYSTFANDGERLPPLFITRIEDSNGKLIEEFKSKSIEITSPQTAYLITSMLEGVVQNGTGAAAKALGRPVAGKTGTTNDQHDAWFIGYTPDLLAGVWVGYDDHRPLGRNATGGHVAAPIWVDFMKDAIRDKPATAFAMPEGIRCVLIDRATGLRARDGDWDAPLECFKEGTEPQAVAPMWQPEPTTPSEASADETVPPADGAPSSPGFPSPSDFPLPSPTAASAAPDAPATDGNVPIPASISAPIPPPIPSAGVDSGPVDDEATPPQPIFQ
jgi:penicillin-binding protein 1A